MDIQLDDTRSRTACCSGIHPPTISYRVDYSKESKPNSNKTHLFDTEIPGTPAIVGTLRSEIVVWCVKGDPMKGNF